MITYFLGKASNNKFRFFIIETDEEWHEPEHGFLIQRSYGQVGGKKTLSPTITVNKKPSSKTWKEQLQLKYNSEVKKILDKGYIQVDKNPNEYTEDELNVLFGDVKTGQDGIIKPQLAKQSEKVTDPKIFDKTWLISRKLDGVKALFYYKDGEIHTASRGGTNYDYSTTHITSDQRLIDFFKTNPTVILDGELFKRGKTLQEISGAARMEKNAYDCGWLEFWVYDCYVQSNSEMKAVERYNLLYHELVESFNIHFYRGIEDDEIKDSIHLLRHTLVKGWDNMMLEHNKYVDEGFEGACITDIDKPYKPGSRGNQLIKIKQYKSEDFKIIDYELGLRGSEDMVFVCELEDGRTFKAMPVGDRAVKEEYVQNFEEKYKGHKAECTFFNYSDSGIPTQGKIRIFRFDLE